MQFLLGTAQFGWQCDRQTAFALLDAWLAAGHRGVDTATNYPLNGQSADFKASERLLAEYIQAHGLRDGQLDITVKVGSMTNERTPDINLSPSFVRMMSDYYQSIFGSNLGCVMLHWDNRTDIAAIKDTLATLTELSAEGLRPGLSGIAHPDVYAHVVSTFFVALKLDIQLKINPLYADWNRYAPLQTAPHQHRWFAYGLTAGGIRLGADYTDTSTLRARGGDAAAAEPALERLRSLLPIWNSAVRPPIKAFWQLGIIRAVYHPQLTGAVLGVRDTAQLRTTLEWIRDVQTFDYADVVKGL
jgi:aryl-alcohol dehydrogenase-like predicted oxidoreductase